MFTVTGCYYNVLFVLLQTLPTHHQKMRRKKKSSDQKRKRNEENIKGIFIAVVLYVIVKALPRVYEKYSTRGVSSG